MIFLDTNIVLAFYVSEAYSAIAQTVYRDNPLPTNSELVELEVYSTLSRLVQTRSIEQGEAQQIADLFVTHLQTGLYNRLHLHAGHYQLASSYISRFDLPLKAPDALHLAVVSTEELIIATADRQLARNAEHLGLKSELITS